MNTGLIKLLKLRYYGALRHGLRQFGRPQRAVLAILGVGAVMLWLAPSLMRGTTADPQDFARFRHVAPLFMLLTCLMPLASAGSRVPLQLTPAEIDFLFPGPFSRREIIVTKLLMTLPGLILSALIVSIVLMKMVPSWPAAALGALLTLSLIQLTGLVVLLLEQMVAAYAFSWARKIALAVVIVVFLAVLGFPLLAGAQSGGLQALGQSPVGRAIALPFTPFVRTMAPNSIGEFVLWGGVSLAIDLILLAGVLQLDVNYNDVALAASQAFYRRRKQLQQRGATGWMTLRSPRIACGPLPWLGGAGPIARRQLTAALRGLPGLGFLLLIIAGPMAAAGLSLRHGGGEMVFLFSVQLIFIPAFLTRMMPFDFRGDLEQMDWLKSLPLAPLAIAAGELVAPVTVMTLIQVALLTILGLAAPSGSEKVLAVALFTLPLNTLLFGLDNLFCLLAPARMQVAGGLSLPFTGRIVAEMLGKMFVLGLTAGIAAAPAAVAYYLAGGSWAAALAVAWLATLPICGLLVASVAWAFRRFDVSLDTP